jgi:hypothetical protein
MMKRMMKMSNDSIWSPTPGGVWDTFFSGIGSDNEEEE